jgi:hypothetical protein
MQLNVSRTSLSYGLINRNRELKDGTFGYDENGELVFRQGPFTFDPEAYDVFQAEREVMESHKVFHLSLERTYLAQDHRNRVAAHASL